MTKASLKTTEPARKGLQAAFSWSSVTAQSMFVFPVVPTTPLLA